jgi:hypothetical protein
MNKSYPLSNITNFNEISIPKGVKHTSITIENVKVDFKSTNTRNIIQITITTPHTLLDYYFRMIQKISRLGFTNPSSLRLFGLTNPTKEILETTSAIKYIKDYTRVNGI